MFQVGDRVRIVVDLPAPHEKFPRAGTEGELVKKEEEPSEVWWQVKTSVSNPGSNWVEGPAKGAWRFKEEEFVPASHLECDWAELELM